jgi:FMN phosphatase YigB (HAD superfamily)
MSPSTTPEPSTAGPLPDRRFEPIDQAVRSGRTRVVSLDVFDTLLWRRVPKPNDVHLLVGRRLAERDALAPHLGARAYARLRTLAEREARSRKQRDHGSVEVTLEEIHAVLAPSATPGLSVDEAARNELAVERQVVFADLRLTDYLRHVVADVADVALVAVSDTYYSPAQVRSLLAATALADLPLADVYTSSDRGTGKGDALWKVVVEDLGIEPDQLVHFGDNFDADVYAAQQVGIRALHYPVATDRYAPIDVREEIVGPPGDPTAWCDERDGDGGLTAMRRRATFLRPPRPITGTEQVAWETGTAVMGPVFTGFAQWVVERAGHVGAERVVCMMREGKFLKSLVERQATAVGARLRVETAWVSREACARASIYTGSEDELRSFLSRLRAPSPDQMLDSLGLEPGDVPELDQLMGHYEATNRAADAGHALVDLVLGRPALVAKVVARSAERRHRLVSHVTTAAGAGDGPVLLVDVGWSGTIQECLQVMVRAEGAPLDLYGLYLLAHVGSSDRVLRGVVLDGFLGGVGTNPFDVAGITGGPELVELVCTSEEGSLLEITADGRPLLEPVSASAAETAARRLVQAGMEAYQHERLLVADMAATAEDGPFETTPAGRAMLGRILKRFLSQPNRDEAEAFSWWQHEENFGSRQVDQLVPERYRRTLAYRTAENLHWAAMSELYWVGGAAALVDNETADSILAMREGTIHPGRFSSPAEAGHLRLTAYGGDGAELATATLPIDSNRKGLSLVEWSGPAAGCARVDIWPAERDALVRIDVVEITATSPDGVVATEFLWQFGDDPALLGASGASWAAPGVLAVDARSRLSVALPRTPSSGALRITVGSAYLSAPAGSTVTASSTSAELDAARRELDAVHNTLVFRVAARPRQLYAAVRRRLNR